MVRKTQLPKFPDDYINEKSEEYDKLKWMERNQKKSTLKCVKYLYDSKLEIKNGQNKKGSLILDLGCGTGFSSEVLIKEGFRVVGVDILEDMIIKGLNKKKRLKGKLTIEFILADINHLPIRGSSITHIISVSAYNFILHNVYNRKEREKIASETAKFLNRVLKENGRLVIEFYPQNENELSLFVSSFLKNQFNGYMIKKSSNQKSGQTFLLLRKL